MKSLIICIYKQQTVYKRIAGHEVVVYLVLISLYDKQGREGGGNNTNIASAINIGGGRG